MTSAHDPDETSVVDEILAGMEAGDAHSLRPVLAELRSLAEAGPVPPNRRLAALLAEAESKPAPVVDLAAARNARTASARSWRRRPVVTAVAVAFAAAAATAGAAAVAQNRVDADGAISSIISSVAGHPSTAATTAPGTPPAVETHLAPAAPSQDSTTAPASNPPTVARDSTVPNGRSSASALPLPTLPVDGTSIAPSPAPSSPNLVPLAKPSGILPSAPPLPGLP
ncbi:hypothetical protein RBS60_06750 [Sinomonas sp. ASV486]|uniref:hypothetical protein n=1 Tax=Sinomonas sp. ASV486 TaxID=3051170 RepID=UPI0027DDE78F|nr:hypothetical protein [Sinomonas sp. ASV486]MDQ4489895.1 hypothetical protein [Sinomonas sp. ASV486]